MICCSTNWPVETKSAGAVRVATTMDHALQPMKATLCQVNRPWIRGVGASALWLWIREESNVLPDLSQGQVLMQVSSVGDGGKRKKSRGKNGKGEDKKKSKNGKGQGQGSRRQLELRHAGSAVPRLLFSLCEVRSQARRVQNTIGSAESWGSRWISRGRR